ncbi:MAG TPA: DUF1573 domain-containing protein [Hyphomicrobiales bacterium]|nr:DUF1573 domain-containing protein [Hyphomicrobiales bacterium]
MARNAKRKSAASGQPKKKEVPFYWVMLGVVAAVVAGYYFFIAADYTAQAVPSYAEEDVAHEGAFTAVHEMGAGPRIPFLPKGGPQPKISIPADYHSFGSIGPRDVVRRKFIVRNDGDAPLTISRAFTTCGCTTAEFSANVIPPGKLAVVTMVFDAGFHDTRGQTVDRGIIIENNDPANPEAEIWARAAVGWR